MNPNPGSLLFYEAPSVLIFPTIGQDILCESPKPGGREDLTYEDWQQYDNDYATT